MNLQLVSKGSRNSVVGSISGPVGSVLMINKWNFMNCRFCRQNTHLVLQVLCTDGKNMFMLFCLDYDPMSLAVEACS